MTQHRASRQARNCILVSSLSLGFMACGPDAFDPAFEASASSNATESSQLINAFTDYGDVNRDSAAWVGGCSGTLVAPDMILTAGHCVGNRPAWEDDTSVGRGTWRPMGRGVDVRIGIDPDNPRYRRTAFWANAAGFDDIVLLLLDSPVPVGDPNNRFGSGVVPPAIMTEAEFTRLGSLNSKTLYMAGYGSTCSGWLTPRRYAIVDFAGGNPRGVNSFRGNLVSYGGTQDLSEGGDSGSPLLWWNSAESRLYITGVFLGTDGLGNNPTCASVRRRNGHFLGTFRTGAGDPDRPNLSAWLSQAVDQSFDRNGFHPTQGLDEWHPYFCLNGEHCDVGDFDGDGVDDIITFTQGSSADVYVGQSYGYRTFSGSTTFPQPGRGFHMALWHGSFGFNNDAVGVFDLSGDGQDDIFAGSATRLMVARSNASGGWGGSFTSAYTAISSGICDPATKDCIPGNIRVDSFNSDDILSIDRASGELTVYRGDGLRLAEDMTFSTTSVLGQCSAPRECRLADINNDGDDDLIIFHKDSTGNVDVARNYRTRFGTPQRWVDFACFRMNFFGTLWERECTLGDVDGDDDLDLVIIDPVTRDIHVARALSSTIELYWHHNIGGTDHVIRSGDFNGDGYDDVVNFTTSRSSSDYGAVFIQASTGGN